MTRSHSLLTPTLDQFKTYTSSSHVSSSPPSQLGTGHHLGEAFLQLCKESFSIGSKMFFLHIPAYPSPWERSERPALSLITQQPLATSSSQLQEQEQDENGAAVSFQPLASCLPCRDQTGRGSPQPLEAWIPHRFGDHCSKAVIYFTKSSNSKKQMQDGLLFHHTMEQ